MDERGKSLQRFGRSLIVLGTALLLLVAFYRGVYWLLGNARKIRQLKWLQIANSSEPLELISEVR